MAKNAENTKLAKNAQTAKMAKNAVKFLLLVWIAGPALALTEQQVHPQTNTGTAAKEENLQKIFKCLHLGGYDAEDCGHGWPVC